MTSYSFIQPPIYPTIYSLSINSITHPTHSPFIHHSSIQSTYPSTINPITPIHPPSSHYLTKSIHYPTHPHTTSPPFPPTHSIFTHPPCSKRHKRQQQPNVPDGDGEWGNGVIKVVSNLL